jgi:soluble lytic murein transglycosylase-like protein
LAAVFKAQLYQESRLNAKAVSPAGAGGIAQFMEATWNEVSEKAGYSGASRWNPADAIPVAAFYMADLIEGWHWPRPEIDRHCLALASYNAGYGNILKSQKAANDAVLYAPIIDALPDITGHHADETTDYVVKILGFYAGLVTGD